MKAALSEILDNLDAIVYVADMKTYEILYLNRYTRDIFGGVVGQTCWRSLQSNQTGPCNFCSNDKLLGPGGTPAGVYRWEFQNTVNKRWYDVRDRAILWPDGRIVRLEIASDITDLKTTQKELLRAKAEWENTFDAIPFIVMVIDKEYRIVRANKALIEKLGTTREDLLGRLCYRVIHKRDEPYALCPHNKTALDGQPHSAEFFEENLQGYYIMSTSPAFDENGQCTGSVEVAYDITERKRAEEEKKKLHQDLLGRAAELERAYKDLESFSYAASHDLRTPLITIEGFCRMLSEDYAGSLDENGRDLLNRVGDNAKKMSQLINDLLSFSRVSAKEIRTADINMESLVKRVFRQLEPTIGNRKVQLKINPFPPACGDLSMIGQVLTNLLANAIKFTEPRETAVIETGGSKEDDKNRYYVRDNGIGFDMQRADKLFTLFHRIHGSKKFKGTGIGLVIVKRIIEKHGGKVWAEGKPHEGSTFYFTLPGKDCGETRQ